MKVSYEEDLAHRFGLQRWAKALPEVMRWAFFQLCNDTSRTDLCGGGWKQPFLSR